MLLAETVTDWDKEPGSEAELKQPDVGPRSVSKETSEVADGEVGLGLPSVEFG